MTKRLHPDPDLDAIVRQLNETAQGASIGEAASEAVLDPDTDDEAEGTGPPARQSAPPTRRRWSLAPATDEGEEWMKRLLAKAQESKASDLLLVAGAPPMMRLSGKLAAASETALGRATTAILCAALVPPSRRAAVEERGAVDFALTRRGIGRLRCNVHREQDGWAAAIRLLPDTIPDLQSLHLPAGLSRFAELDYGLVLVTGPTGAGKSTTLAALLKWILARRRVHVITIEDPIEYEHPHGNSVVEHVEIGRDAPSFAQALRAALRQDPDVLLIGEMRDPESMSIAITAAETGHLVLSTLHTGDAPQTIHRIIDSYSAAQQDFVRVQLALSLAGIVSQQLLPRKDGRGRVPAVEVLIATPAVRNLVRQSKIALLRSQIALERSAGMLGLDQSLAALVKAGLVDAAEARVRARVPEEFEQLMRRGEGA